MIVFVNAISIVEGGSLVVLRRLLEEMIPLRSDIVWHVAVSRRFPALEALNALRITTWVIPWNSASAFGVNYWYEWALPRLLRRTGADVLYSLTNYLPRRSIPIPSLLLVQHAGHFSALFRQLTEQRYPGPHARLAWRAKSAWVRASVRRASLVTVQTRALARALAEQTGVPARQIVVVPHGPGLNRIASAHKHPTSGRWRIGYITKYGVQKNFRVLFLAVKRLLERGHDVRLVLTLQQDTSEYGWIAGDLAQAGIESCIENHGEIAQDAMEALYDSLDLFAFPSLCESFGFPIVEAMARGLPLALADTESNREVAGAGADYFGAEDDAALADRLEHLMKDPDAYASAARRSIARAAEFSWRAAGRGTMDCLERTALPKGISPQKYPAAPDRRNALQASTRLHYDAHPLDFMSAEDERFIAAQQPAPFREFVGTYLAPGQRVADIGCGPGRATLYLAQTGMDVCAVDISVASLGLARKRAPGALYVCASNLALPLPDRSFDAVVSDGVIHHTPDAAAAFRENARLIKHGGYLYLGVYRRYRYYYYLYNYLGIPVRWLSRRRWGTWLLEATLLPVYYLVHLLKSGGRRSWAGAKNFFYDYIITPRASFHTYEQIEGWALAAGMHVVGYVENVGNVHAFVLRKNEH